MNNEIKEILDRAKNLKYKCDCCEEIAPGKYVMRDDKQTDNIIEAVYIIDKLLDYITNLQQENISLAKENEQEKQFIKDCGFKNVQQLALDYIGIRQEKEDYKSRCEKAIPMLKELNIKLKGILNTGIDIKEISDIEDTLNDKE